MTLHQKDILIDCLLAILILIATIVAIVKGVK